MHRFRMGADCGSHNEAMSARRRGYAQQSVFQEEAMPKLIVSPAIVQCVGNMNKTANEFVGLVNTGDEEISITRVQSPPGWIGIGQCSDYREYRLVLAGTLHVEHPDGAFDMQAGQCLDVEPGEWVRYSTPGPAGADYMTVCIPAFSRASVHRDA
jgi:mannose-6-phosphate isomerase-like protein (cupin superfamily)